jgi:energy-coupling factor transport system permease protein
MLTRPLVVMESVIVPILTRSASIADELAAASVSRGIESGNARSSVYALRFSGIDVLLLLLFFALVALAVFSRLGVLPW